MSDNTRALLAEAAGTFWFFTIGAGSIVVLAANGSPPLSLLAVALAHGLVLSVAISTFGALSGGHFNPAVTFGVAVAKKLPWSRVPGYWVAQLIGAVVAGLALSYFFSGSPAAGQTHLGTPALQAGYPVLSAIVVEAVLTLFLVWAVFGTAVSSKAPRIGGFGIGLTVAADILLGGPLTGAAMNPARWFGPALVSGFLDNWYVYWIGPLIGAAIAGLSYRYIFAPTEDRA